MYYIGVDNGVTGSIGIVNDKGDFALSVKTPVKRVLNYTKSKKNPWVNHIDHVKFSNVLAQFTNCKCMLERPFINYHYFTSSISAAKSHMATLIILEDLGISFEYIDSKEWQKVLLPHVKGTKDLKKASLLTGRRLFPGCKFTGDADGILISEYCRRINGHGDRR